MRNNPLIYEVNTWVWLDTLRYAARHERGGPATVTLADVPESALAALVQTGADAIWFMGVWERSPRGQAQALSHPGLLQEYARALPDVTAADVVGSPYAVRRYRVDARLGGEAGLAAMRARLAERGVRLLLDLVPNHVALDHPWTRELPGALLRGTRADLHAHPDAFFVAEDSDAVIAHGRDPYFAPWSDTAQVNALSPELRGALRDEIMHLATLCDGVRCDMAMLLVDRVFRKTWRHLLAATPELNAQTCHTELWRELIEPVKAAHPAFLFLAEVYWDMESELQGLGFDYTYDKRLYDRLRADATSAVSSVRDHLLADLAYQRRLVRFVENHDEPRAFAEFGPERAQAAATLALTLPGARLVHDGQSEGRAVKLPVQLGRLPDEELQTPAHQALRDHHQRLLRELHGAPYHDGLFVALGTRPILGTDAGHLSLLAHAWMLGDELRVVVVNYSPRAVSGRVMLPLGPLARAVESGRDAGWRFTDVLTPELRPVYAAEDLLTHGLQVHLGAWGSHVFVVEPALLPAQPAS